MAELIAIAGSLAQQPGRGGHTWVFLQYLRGLRQLGYEVFFIDQIDSASCVTRSGSPAPVADSWNVAYLTDVMNRYGFRGDFTLLNEHGQSARGVSRGEALARLGRATTIINVMGFLRDEQFLAAAPRRVFLDIDPGFGQMWHDLGLADVFTRHDDFVTIGENIGRDGCTIPTCGRDWIHTPQPVVLADWPVVQGGSAFTTVASWRGLFGPIDYGGETYGLRVHEFRKFISLPQRTKPPFEIALDIDPNETRDLTLLAASGWQVVDPGEVARDPAAYQTYIQRSRGEICIAKNIYVRTGSGWLSDRSLCYLATGKPVVAQDTGFSRRYPYREGLVPFQSLDEAVAAVEDVQSDYARHARAARAVAEEHFDSAKVLSRLLQALGVR
jgi:hypothetical protein